MNDGGNSTYYGDHVGGDECHSDGGRCEGGDDEGGDGGNEDGGDGDRTSHSANGPITAIDRGASWLPGGGKGSTPGSFLSKTMDLAAASLARRRCEGESRADWVEGGDECGIKHNSTGGACGAT